MLRCYRQKVAEITCSERSNFTELYRGVDFRADSTDKKGQKATSERKDQMHVCDESVIIANLLYRTNDRVIGTTFQISLDICLGRGMGALRVFRLRVCVCVFARGRARAFASVCLCV